MTVNSMFLLSAIRIITFVIWVVKITTDISSAPNAPNDNEFHRQIFSQNRKGVAVFQIIGLEINLKCLKSF